ncbi:MAG: hypothetical protein ACFHWX_08780 [Bacteroidota bacterium]
MKDSSHTAPTKEVLQQLDKILQSEAFKSEKNQQLLKYLVDKSLQNEQPKETTIALEFFNEQSVNDKDTSYVRVAVYHIRKRLKEYYLTDGKSDRLKFTLEKGSYLVEFKQVNPNKENRRFNKPLLIALWTISIVVAFLSGYLILDHRGPDISTDNIIFQDLASNDKPVLVVLGDLFMYSEKDGTLVRNYNINRLDELEAEKPELIELNQSRSKYLTRMHAISTFNISNMLHSLKRPVNFRMASELTIEDLKENNIIFIGYFKSLYLLDTYYNISHFDPGPSYGYLLDKSTRDTIEIVGNPGQLHKDYGVFSRISGIENTFIYLIAGFTDTSVEMISSKVLKQGFMEKIGIEDFSEKKLPEFFEILFEVEGYDRKELSNISVVEANEIVDLARMWD